MVRCNTGARARVSQHANRYTRTRARARAHTHTHTRTRARARTHTLGLFLLFLSAVFATFKFEFACGEDGEDCESVGRVWILWFIAVANQAPQIAMYQLLFFTMVMDFWAFMFRTEIKTTGAGFYYVAHS